MGKAGPFTKEEIAAMRSALWVQETRRARKPYKCCECGEEIRAGALHDFAKTLYDGRWSAWRTCARCANLWRDYARGGREMGGLAEY